MDSVGSNTITKGIILAGGFGTRLQSVVSDKPKSLAEVSGRPFIEYQLEWLMQQGIRDVTLAVHHMASQLQTFTEQWSNEKLRLHTVYEQDPLGTGGALVNVIQQRKMIGKVLVINGDTLFLSKGNFLKLPYEASDGLVLDQTTFKALNDSNLWNANKLHGKTISTDPPDAGQFLKWDGTVWKPVSDPAGVGKGSNATTLIYLGSGF